MSNSSSADPTLMPIADQPRRASRHSRREASAVWRCLRGAHFKAVRANSRGAIIVEFAVVLMPLLITLFSFLQMGYLYQSVLVLRHATEVAARAAAVITVKEDNNPNGSGKEAEVTEAAVRAAGRFADSGLIHDIKVQIQDDSSKADPYGYVKVTLTATIECNVPLGGQIACLAKGNITKTLKAEYPHQGALYKLEEKKK